MTPSPSALFLFQESLSKLIILHSSFLLNIERIAFGVLGALVLAVSLGVHAYTHNMAQSLLAGTACALLSYVYGVWPYRQLQHIPGPEPHVFFGT